MKRLRRILSVVLSAAMILQMGFTPAMAKTTTVDKLCEHHQHTADCGYTEGADCTHTHDKTCGYVERTPEQPCTFVEKALSANAAAPHTHNAACGFAEAVAGAACTHQHTVDCGYVEGTPCTFTKEQCEMCTPQNSGDMPVLDVSNITVTKFDTLPTEVTQRVVSVDTTLKELKLPTTLKAMGYTITADTEVVDSGTPSNDTTPAAIRIEGVTWALDPAKNVNANKEYNPLLGTYCFTPILPEGYTLAEGVALPELWVRVGDKARAAAGTFTVIGGESGKDYSYAPGVLTILTSKSLAISNAEATADRIVVKIDVAANLTLNGVNIVTDGMRLHPLAIPSGATANLTLTGTNTLTSTGQFSAGIHVPTGATLTIGGTGTLTATGGGSNSGGIVLDGGAGIGGAVIADEVSGGHDGGSGKITINGGKVTAQGGLIAAGIGSSSRGSVDEIIINGGTVTATGGSDAAGIGSSVTGSGGKITITDGEVIATSVGNGAGIGGDGCEITIKGGKVTATGADAAAGIGGNANKSGGKIAISGGTVEAQGGQYGAGIGGGKNQSGGTIAISGGTVEAQGGQYGAGIGGGKVGGDGGTITISDTTTVRAKGGESGAGIGGGVAASGGKITISGGTANAEGGKNGAGIGGGGQGAIPGDGGTAPSGNGGEITISGGKVEATGGQYGAGIGGGKGGNGGTIAIKEAAEVTATGGEFGAGIGGGSGSGSGTVLGGSGGGNGGEIAISGGTVNAKGGKNGAGIGGGDSGSGGEITIKGGTVGATAGGDKTTGGGAGIGGGGSSGGTGGAGGIITISGGVVSATGWKSNAFTGGAGIGGGAGSTQGEIGGAGAAVTISGGTVTANGGVKTANGGVKTYTGAIGAGEWGTDPGTLTITGGSVQLVQGTVAKSTPAKNGGKDLKPVTLTMGSVASTSLTWLNFPGYDYGAEDVQTDGDGKVYVWLPTTGTPATVYATAVDSFYGSILSTDTDVTLKKFDIEVTTLDELNAAITAVKKQILVNGSFDIAADATVEITGGVTITIKPGVTIINNGIIALMDGKMNYGTGYGDITVNKVAVPSTATLDVLDSSGTEIITATYGDTVTLKVTAEASVPRSRSAIRNQAIFYLGTSATGTKLGEANVTYADGKATATLSMTLQDVAVIDWAIGENNLFVEFGGSSIGGLLDSTANGSLTVTAKSLTITGLTTQGRDYNGTTNITLIGGSTLNGVLSGEAVTATMPTTGSVETADVGKAKPVTIVLPTLGGTHAGNYTLTAPTLSVNIDPANPTLTWSNGSEELFYTGSTAVLATALTVDGVNGETPDGAITYTYDKNGEGTIVNGLPTDEGFYFVKAHMAASGNYRYAFTATELMLTITRSTPTLVIKADYSGKTYGGKPIDKPTADQMTIKNAAYANVKFAYSVNASMTPLLTEAPKAAGTYYVRASVEATANTAAAKSEVVSFTIAQAPLTITGGTVTPKQWDGETTATVTALTFGGLQNSETLAITTDYLVGAPAYDNADVGASKTVTGTASLVSNTKTKNYTLTGSYSITGQAITLADGPAAPTYSTMDDAKGTDTYTFNSTNDTVYEYSTNGGSTWSDITATGATTEIPVGNIAVAAGDLQVRVKATATHEAGAILKSVTAFTASIAGSVSISGPATYGETLTAAATGTQEGAVLSYEWKSGTTVLQAKSTKKTYKIAGVAVGKTITVEVTATGYNEKLTSTTTSAVAKKAVTATVGTISKEYDRSNTVETADYTLTIAKITDDDITVTAPSATYNDKTVGTGKAITLGKLTITGAAKNWYEVTAPSSITGDISAKAVTVTAVVAEKVYDGKTNATATYTVTGKIAADTVTVSGKATFADANADSDKTVNITDISLEGTDGGNYKQSSTIATAQGTITKKGLTIASYTPDNKDYDGTTDAVVSAVVFEGLQNSEMLTMDTDFTVSASFANKNVGTAVAVAGKVTLTDSDKAKNYKMSKDRFTGLTTAAISAVAPTYDVSDQFVRIGKTLDAIQAAATAVGVGGETVAGTPVWSESANGVPLTTYTFIGSAGDTKTLFWTFTPTDTNYKATTDSTVFTLTAKEIPVLTVANVTKPYDGVALTTVTGTAKSGETTVEGTFAFESAPEMKDVGSYNVMVKFTPTNTADYTTATTRIAVTINKATINVAARSYNISTGDAAPALDASSYTIRGVATGETLQTKPSVRYEQTPDTSKAGSVKILVSGAKAPDGGNYNDIVYNYGLLTIKQKDGGGNTGGGGGGDNSSIVTPNPTPEKPISPTTAESNVSSKTDKNGNAIAVAADKDITNAIEKAQKEAKKNGTESNGIAMILNINTDKNATALGITLPKQSVVDLIAGNVTQVTVKNNLSTVTLDLVTLKALTGGDVVLTIRKADTTKLSKQAKTAIGNRPVFQFGLTSGGKTVSDFKGGRAGLQIPYTLTTSEQAGNLCGVYVNGNGTLTWLEQSSYDPITNRMLISATHFSTYGIGYKQSTPKFTDVGTHWAKNEIDFVVTRGLLGGTGSTTFSPNTAMTRGMFVTALGRLAGVDTAKFESTQFTDVKADAYYAPYVAWANVNGIVKGTSDTTFSPDTSITREQMAVMLVNYSKTIGYKLPNVHAEIRFADASNISAGAKDAVKQMQMAGILMGKSGNRFDPTAAATRAEVSAMLRRYVELVVSTETAEGWMMNDSGKWMYYEKGKAMTGKKKLAGATYIFDQYGETAEALKNVTYGSYIVKKGDSFWKIAFEQQSNLFELAKANGKTIFSRIYAGDELKIPQK